MNAYVLEILFPTGWRRSGELHWRYADATEAATVAVYQSAARAARVLPVHVLANDVFSIERPASTGIADMEDLSDE
ncbi:hypothetical protein FF011L_05630 [Roseimaritima multifibrata]|uniref:Uncharacterized protein n=1 Tax=Roseimaritima multifibrata TaxID=1930274 RepID=A0A517MAB0_9BACT|nr:hypothetical protein [Roseimaritima multifibrata]QDS91828.1 hypothetical protein FF011L_05630 [Roseimaritima multifibrata]